jgi:hypothetical protein
VEARDLAAERVDVDHCGAGDIAIRRLEVETALC